MCGYPRFSEQLFPIQNLSEHVQVTSASLCLSSMRSWTEIAEILALNVQGNTNLEWQMKRLTIIVFATRQSQKSWHWTRELKHQPSNWLEKLQLQYEPQSWRCFAFFCDYLFVFRRNTLTKCLDLKTEAIAIQLSCSRKRSVLGSLLPDSRLRKRSRSRSVAAADLDDTQLMQLIGCLLMTVGLPDVNIIMIYV